MPVSVAKIPNVYGVDLAISGSGDLIVNSAGGLQPIGEVAILAQALLLRLRTIVGDLALHPEYGTNLPIGAKIDPTAMTAALNGELRQTLTNDPRFASAAVKEVFSPAGNNPSAISFVVEVVASGGTTFLIAGLPAEARVSEVTLSEGVTAEPVGALAPVEEQEFFAGEEEEAQVQQEGKVQSLVNDLPPEGET